MEKEMATHSSTVAWRIPRMEEPGAPWSMGSHAGNTYKFPGDRDSVLFTHIPPAFTVVPCA